MAQDAPTRVTLPGQLKTQNFSLVNPDATTETRTSTFCLPKTEELVKVIGVITQQSNAASKINVDGDLSTNCITVEAILPPAPQRCYAAPAPTFSEPSRIANKCITVSPTILNFVVQYQSRAGAK
jgi:hypothetical protein